MSETEKPVRIWYLCDGEKPECKKKHCSKNADIDPCRHTQDINHAVNFEKCERAGRVSYWEKPPQHIDATVEREERLKKEMPVTLELEDFSDGEKCSVTAVVGGRKQQSITSQTKDCVTWAFEQTSHQMDLK